MGNVIGKGTKLRTIHHKIHTLDSFKFRNYRFFWISSTSSGVGFLLQQVVIGWIIYDLTNSPLLTTLALSIDFAFALGAPIGGLIADTQNKKRLLFLCYIFQMMITLMLSVIIIMDRLEIWHIFAFTTLMGSSYIIHDPCRTSLISSLVPNKLLVNAFALASLGFSFSRLIVPVLGGVLLATSGAGIALLSEAIAILIASALILRLNDTTSSSIKIYPSSYPSALLETIRYIKNTPNLFFVMMLSGIPWVIVAPFTIGLMPVYAVEVFDVGPTGLGTLLTTMGIGSTTATVILATFLDNYRKGPLILSCIAVTIIALTIYSQSSSMGIAIPCLIIISGAMMVINTITRATTQSMSDDKFRGRVSGFTWAISGLFPIGSLLSGILAEHLSVSGATLIGAGILLFILIFIILFKKTIWRF